MGGGSWTRATFDNYSKKMGRSVRIDGSTDVKKMSASQVYKQRQLAKELNPYNVIRECRDSVEHPNTIPVILALDVTGSMGQTAVEVSAELNNIMTSIYKEVADVEFMVMGIGDFVFDNSPLQVSQFESDIRIAEQLDKVYFEFGGGSNKWESYSSAWAFGVNQTDLDCWKRGRKGIIITMGDEELNPSLPLDEYIKVTGKGNELVQSGAHDIDTKDLYKVVNEKYEIYHINVKHGSRNPDLSRFEEIIGKDHVFTVPVSGVAQVITDIVSGYNQVSSSNSSSGSGEISW